MRSVFAFVRFERAKAVEAMAAFLYIFAMTAVTSTVFVDTVAVKYLVVFEESLRAPVRRTCLPIVFPMRL